MDSQQTIDESDSRNTKPHSSQRRKKAEIRQSTRVSEVNIEENVVDHSDENARNNNHGGPSQLREVQAVFASVQTENGENVETLGKKAGNVERSLGKWQAKQEKEYLNDQETSDKRQNQPSDETKDPTNNSSVKENGKQKVAPDSSATLGDSQDNCNWRRYPDRRGNSILGSRGQWNKQTGNKKLNERDGGKPSRSPHSHNQGPSYRSNQSPRKRRKDFRGGRKADVKNSNDSRRSSANRLNKSQIAIEVDVESGGNSEQDLSTTNQNASIAASKKHYNIVQDKQISSQVIVQLQSSENSKVHSEVTEESTCNISYKTPQRNLRSIENRFAADKIDGQDQAKCAAVYRADDRGEQQAQHSINSGQQGAPPTLDSGAKASSAAPDQRCTNRAAACMLPEAVGAERASPRTQQRAHSFTRNADSACGPTNHDTCTQDKEQDTQEANDKREKARWQIGQGNEKCNGRFCTNATSEIATQTTGIKTNEEHGSNGCENLGAGDDGDGMEAHGSGSAEWFQQGVSGSIGSVSQANAYGYVFPGMVQAGIGLCEVLPGLNRGTTWASLPHFYNAELVRYAWYPVYQMQCMRPVCSVTDHGQSLLIVAFWMLNYLNGASWTDLTQFMNERTMAQNEAYWILQFARVTRSLRGFDAEIQPSYEIVWVAEGDLVPYGVVTVEFQLLLVYWIRQQWTARKWGELEEWMRARGFVRGWWEWKDRLTLMVSDIRGAGLKVKAVWGETRYQNNNLPALMLERR